MKKPDTDRPKRKSRLAARTGNINMALLAMVLILMVSAAVFIIDGIKKENAKNLARAYSTEAAQMFYSYISQDLALVRKASNSKVITSWFADEGDPVKKSAAFDEMMDYINILQGARLYFGINDSLNEYSINTGATLDEFVPFDILNPSVAYNNWYYDCVGSKNGFTLNIDVDKVTDAQYLWINHKVAAGSVLAGAFCSGLELKTLFNNVFGRYDAKYARAFVIDSRGIIKMDSVSPGYDSGQNVSITEENPDPEFASRLGAYLERIDGSFKPLARPELVKLSRGSYRYASIAPITGSDWSVAFFYYGGFLSGVKNALALVIAMLAALFLYVAGRNALMNRFVIDPLNRLNREVSEGTGGVFSSSSRDDEIGELARSIQDVTGEQQRQKQLLHAVNSAAVVLLVPEDGEDYRESVLSGMDIIGRCINVDRVHIWQNETIDGVSHYVNKVHWLKESGLLSQPVAVMRPYSEMPGWETKFLNNEFVNGPVSGLTEEERGVLEPQGIKSILAIPLFMQDEFFGFFSLDDCRQERTFREDEVEILRSAGLMIVSAMNRNAQAAKIQKAHEYNRLMLNANPLGCHIWDKNFKAIDCNDAAVKLFNMKDKQEYLDRFFDLSPLYQPDGSFSSDALVPHVLKAFKEGQTVYEWVYQRLDGTPVPAEVTLVRIPFEDDYIVAGYIHDLREYKQILKKISQRDKLLGMGNDAAAVLLSTNNGDDFEVSLGKGMEYMGQCLDVDRVQIWRNEMKDGELCFVLDYQWLSDFGRETVSIPIGFTYRYRDTPEWEQRFRSNEYINMPFYGLSSRDKDLLRPLEIKSIVLFPLFIQNQYWGFFSFDDCHCEHVFDEDEIDILRSGCLMMINALHRNKQEAQLRQAHEHSKVLLDAMPMTCHLWNREGKIFDCNEATMKLFKVKDKKEFLDSFFDLSPEYQLDGKRSTEKAAENLKKAFDEGRATFDWMHRTLDGSLLPMEVTAVRVNFGDEEAVAAYARDLREYEQMMQEIERRDFLLNIVNNAATILLQSEAGRFENDLYRCMRMLADAVDVQRVSIWKNSVRNGELYCSVVYQWTEGITAPGSKAYLEEVSYKEKIPDWEGILSRGSCINGYVSDRPPVEQAYLVPQGIISLFVMPVFVQDKFWGMVGFDDYQNERIFSENEQFILRSGGMIITNALLRNEMTLDIHATATKLAAVVANYTGIIWSVDKDFMITLYNGLLLKQQKKTPSLIEGRKLEDYMDQEQYSSTVENIHKTFSDGPQDWVSRIDGRIYHARSTPIFDEQGLTSSIVGSFDDITELSRLQDDLESALEIAQNANQAKSNFLASMSHEMRTPLNAIIGLSELSLESNGLQGENYSNLEKINNAGMTLLSTVNDILDISKIEAGKFQLVPVEYDVPSLINDIISQNILIGGDKPIKFVLDLSENLPARLYGDDLRVKQIMNNLLSNAFKYTREGTVELSMSCIKSGPSAPNENERIVWIIVQVRDTGIGIKSSDIGNLFSDYSQVDLLANRRIEGTGLGLPITKKIAEMMNGSVSVNSEYGKGSIFTLWFQQRFVSDDSIGKEVLDNLKNFRYSDQKRRRNSKMVRISLPYARVLVVDDVVTNLDVARGMMKPYRMKVDCVTSGQEAINAIRAENVRYNAIFMDYMMPEMDGVEATRIIREEIGSEYAKTIPIIALTADAIVGSEKKFLEKGFQAFISKPIEIGRLDSVIREWVRDKEAEKKWEKVNVEGQELLDSRTGKPRRAVSGRRSGMDRRAFGRSIPGIDLERGLERFNGDHKSFIKVLRSYAVNTRALLEKNKDVREENLHEYAIAVHGIKSSSRSICADFIGAEAEALEKAANAGNFPFVAAGNPEFIEAVNELIDSLENALDRMEEENSKPVKDRPDAELLGRLIDACQAYDIDAIDKIMDEIESFEYEADGGLAAWLRENVDLMNLTQIVDRLSEETA